MNTKTPKPIVFKKGRFAFISSLVGDTEEEAVMLTIFVYRRFMLTLAPTFRVAIVPKSEMRYDA